MILNLKKSFFKSLNRLTKKIFLHYDQPPRHEVINNMKDDFKEIRIIDEYEKKKKPNNEDVLDFLVVVCIYYNLV